MPIAIAGLVAGLTGLLLGGAAFARARRPAREAAMADHPTTSSSV